MPATHAGRRTQDGISAAEFGQLTRGLQTAFLAELLGVSKQMICRYRLHGAPTRRVVVLRAYLRERADTAHENHN
jgi:hypothetical protein